MCDGCQVLVSAARPVAHRASLARHDACGIAMRAWRASRVSRGLTRTAAAGGDGGGRGEGATATVIALFADEHSATSGPPSG